MASIMAGVFSMLAASFGYFALCEWMRQFSSLYSGLMFIGAVVFFILGSAHHVFFGAIEWFYIRLGRTEEAFEAIVEFVKKLPPRCTAATQVCSFFLWFSSLPSSPEPPPCQSGPAFSTSCPSFSSSPPSTSLAPGIW